MSYPVLIEDDGQGSIEPWFRQRTPQELERELQHLEAMRRLEELHKAAGAYVRPKV